MCDLSGADPLDRVAWSGGFRIYQVLPTLSNKKLASPYSQIPDVMMMMMIKIHAHRSLNVSVNRKLITARVNQCTHNEPVNVNPQGGGGIAT